MKRVHSVDDPILLMFNNILGQLSSPEKQTLLELLLDDQQRQKFSEPEPSMLSEHFFNKLEALDDSVDWELLKREELLTRIKFLPIGTEERESVLHLMKLAEAKKTPRTTLFMQAKVEELAMQNLRKMSSRTIPAGALNYLYYLRYIKPEPSVVKMIDAFYQVYTGKLEVNSSIVNTALNNHRENNPNKLSRYEVMRAVNAHENSPQEVARKKSISGFFGFNKPKSTLLDTVIKETLLNPKLSDEQRYLELQRVTKKHPDLDLTKNMSKALEPEQKFDNEQEQVQGSPTETKKD